MSNKPAYKILDEKGRILIPKELRAATGMNHGDIIKLTVQKGVVNAKKVDIIEVGDQSPQAVEAYVFSVVKTMQKQALLSLAAQLIALIEESTKK